MGGDGFSYVVDHTEPKNLKESIIGRVNLDLKPDDWCRYKGGPKSCKMYHLVNFELCCLYCSWREPLDIPEIIRQHLERYKK